MGHSTMTSSVVVARLNRPDCQKFEDRFYWPSQTFGQMSKSGSGPARVI